MLILAVLVALFGVNPLGEPSGLPPEAPVVTRAIEIPDRAPEPQVPTGRFETAAEVRPVLDAVRASWVAVREHEGQDLLYFTSLLSWRCGLWEVRYGLNGAPPETVVPLEPCHRDTASPNAMVEPEDFPPYVAAPLGSIETVDVVVVFDDGAADGAVYARRSVLMP